MKAYIISVIFIIGMLAGLTATAYQLSEFNDKVAKEMVASYNQ